MTSLIPAYLLSSLSKSRIASVGRANPFPLFPSERVSRCLSVPSIHGTSRRYLNTTTTTTTTTTSQQSPTQSSTPSSSSSSTLSQIKIPLPSTSTPPPFSLKSTLSPSTIRSPTPTHVTTLPNGLQIASEESPGHFVSVGVYIDAGTRYETKEMSGASHLLDRMAFKGTRDLSTSELVAKLESLGGNIMAHSTRENIVYQSSVFPHHLPLVLDLYSQVIRHPLFLDQELKESKESTYFEISELTSKPEAILPETLHSLAFQRNSTPPSSSFFSSLSSSSSSSSSNSFSSATSGLMKGSDSSSIGNPLICPLDKLESMSPSVLHKYKETFFTPDRIVIAGMGMSHESLVSLCTTYFGDMPRPSPQAIQYASSLKVSPVYSGGISIVDTRLEPPPLTPPHPDQVPLTHLYLAFESLSMSDPDIYALAVLNTLMGGGGSFSAGGPGKGMYTRLYTQVLNSWHWVETCSMYNYSYTDTGLFGIMMSIPDSSTSGNYIRKGSGQESLPLQALNLLCSQVIGMTEGFKALEVSRAKNQLTSNLLMSLESRSVAVEDLGRQVMILGKKTPTSLLTERISRVTKADLIRVAQRIILGRDDLAPTPTQLSQRAKEDEDGGQGWEVWKRKGPWRPTLIIHGADTVDRTKAVKLLSNWGLSST